MTTTQETLLQLSYSVLLAHVAGGLICFFTLCQIAMGVNESNTFEPIILLITWMAFIGLAVFTYRGYLNYKEIICLQKTLDIPPEAKPCLKAEMIFGVTGAAFACGGFVMLSLIVSLYITFAATGWSVPILGLNF